MYYVLNVDKLLWATADFSVSPIQREAAEYPNEESASLMAKTIGKHRKETTWGVFKFEEWE